MSDRQHDRFLLCPRGYGAVEIPCRNDLKTHCHRLAGEFRPEYVTSEHAVLETGR